MRRAKSFISGPWELSTTNRGEARSNLDAQGAARCQKFSHPSSRYATWRFPKIVTFPTPTHENLEIMKPMPRRFEVQALSNMPPELELVIRAVRARSPENDDRIRALLSGRLNWN